MSDNLPAKKTLSISDAADYLGVSAETLRRWDRKGKFKAFRTKGGQRRYSFRDLEAYRLGRVKPTKLTISQAAQQIGVHPETLRRWEREGKVEAERTQGGQRRFTSEHIEDIVSEVPTPSMSAKDALPPIPAEDKKVVVAETPSPSPEAKLAPSGPSPKPVPVRSMKHYRPIPKTSGLISKVLVSALVVLAFFGITWSLMSDLYKERLSRAFSPAPVSPIVDVNDIAGYKLSGDTILGILFKFPLEVEGLATKTLAVLEEAVLNTSRFLGTVFFGSDNSYFISPTGDAAFSSVVSSKVDADILSSITIKVDKLNVEDLVVSGTSTGVTGTGGGGGIATGGDADTLESQSGSYYLNWGNFTAKPTILSSLDGVSNNEGDIDLLAGSNITITPDDGANTITITSIAGSDADTLDTLDFLSFLRSDADDAFTSGTLTFNSSTALTINAGATLSVLGAFTCIDCINDTHITDIYLFNNGDTATGTYTFEDDVTLGLTSADTLIFNGLVSSDIIPIDDNRDLGSAGVRWSNIFADEINATTIVGTISGGETTSSDWRIHSANASADTEDVTITFDRGTESPNAVLRWDATLDRYRFESFPVYLDDSLTSASTLQGTQLISTIATGTAPFIIASTTPVSNLNVDQLDSLDSLQFLRSDTTDNFTSGTLTTDAGTTLDVNGNLAWGGATVTENLNMATNIIENIGNGGTDFDTNGGLTLAGDLTIDGGELFLTGISSSSSTTEGTIYFDSDNSRLYVYQSGAFQELTTGLSKYSATDATLANQGYIEIAHNQSTNDLSLTAWYYDSILGQWRTIENFSTTLKQSLQNEFDDAPSDALTRTETIGSVGGSDVQLQQSADVGNGADGAITISSSVNLNTIDVASGRSCDDGGDAVNYSVTALTSNTATLSFSPSAGCLASGDEILLINIQGTTASIVNVGNYETLRVYSVSTNVVTFVTNKTKYYGDTGGADTGIGVTSSDQRVMLQRIPNYTTVTVNSSGTITASIWDGTTGGVVAFKANTSVMVNSSGSISTTGSGYNGGPSSTGTAQTGIQGESYNFDSTTRSTSANLGAGGGGCGDTGVSGGGGGAGYGVGGTTGERDPSFCSPGGAGGGTYGDAGLSTLFLGSGGGGGGHDQSSEGGSSGAGGRGGGIVYIATDSLTVSGSITVSGNNGANANTNGGNSEGGGGGGGAGGSVRLEGRSLSLGTSLVTSSGGSGGNGHPSYTNDGGPGGVGRIAVFYYSLSGSSSPGATETEVGYYPYGLYHSAVIPTSNSTALENLRWEANLPANTKVSFQTRSGNSTDPTDESWESWKPDASSMGGCASPNCVVLESADIEGNWVETNAVVVEGDVTRNVNYFEDDDESNNVKLTKITSSTNGGYAEATPTGSPVDISSYDYITLWIRASQTGNVLRFGFGEAAATEQTEDITIDIADTWQKIYWDLSDITGTDRDAITKLRITNLTTASNTFYIDNVRAEVLMENLEGTQITSAPNNYFQYRAILTTTNTLALPELENVSLVYNSGYRVQQPNNNTVRLYNFTGEEQNVRLEAIVFGADLAEWYPTSDLSIEAGDVVSIAGEKDDSGVPKIKKSDRLGDPKLMGIISTKAGVELGIPRDDRRLVGLSGRVPVKIAPDSASIQAGDLLTSSGTYPGMAQKATTPGFIVAKAFDNWSPDSGTEKISAFINISWGDPSVLIDQDGDAAEVVDEVEENEITNTLEQGEEVERPAEEVDEEPEIEVSKILPKVESKEGIFERLSVAIEAVFESLVAKTAKIALAIIQNLKVQNIEVTGPTLGTATLLQGEISVEVQNAEVSPNSRIFITPRAVTTAPLAVIQINEGESFTVSIAEPQVVDVPFDFWIVGKKNSTLTGGSEKE